MEGLLEAKVKFLAAEVLHGCGSILLDNEGQHFADELGHCDYITGHIWQNGKYPIHLVLNGVDGKVLVSRGLLHTLPKGPDM